jgi:hypothetical protein
LNSINFSVVLLDAIKHKYGTLVPSTRLANEIYRITDGEISLTSEAIRKWMRGKSIPSGNALFALDELLGDYFVQKRKSKNYKNRIVNSLELVDIEELRRTQRLIQSKIEISNVLSKPDYSNAQEVEE